MIEELTKLYQRLQDVQELGNQTMDDDAETIEVDREWLVQMMAVVSDAIDLLGPVSTEAPVETAEEFVERMVRENSIHPRPEYEGEHTR